MTEWESECLHWRGQILRGKFKHYCGDYDGLPVDETCDEWPCNCLIAPEKSRLSSFFLRGIHRVWNFLRGLIWPLLKIARSSFFSFERK